MYFHTSFSVASHPNTVASETSSGTNPALAFDRFCFHLYPLYILCNLHPTHPAADFDRLFKIRSDEARLAGE